MKKIIQIIALYTIICLSHSMYGAAISRLDDKLEIAASNGSVQEVRDIIKRLESTKKLTKELLYVALWMAAKRHLDVVNILLEKGAPVDSQFNSTNALYASTTPLMRAAEGKKPEIERVLIEKGADIYARNSNGQTAFDIDKGLQKVLDSINEDEKKVQAAIPAKIEAMLPKIKKEFALENTEIFTQQTFSELIADKGKNFTLAVVPAGDTYHYFDLAELRKSFASAVGKKDPLNKQPIKTLYLFKYSLIQKNKTPSFPFEYTKTEDVDSASKSPSPAVHQAYNPGVDPRGIHVNYGPSQHVPASQHTTVQQEQLSRIDYSALTHSRQHDPRFVSYPSPTNNSDQSEKTAVHQACIPGVDPRGIHVNYGPSQHAPASQHTAAQQE